MARRAVDTSCSVAKIRRPACEGTRRYGKSIHVHAIGHAELRVSELDTISVDSKQRREYAVPVRHMCNPMPATDMSKVHRRPIRLSGEFNGVKRFYARRTTCVQNGNWDSRCQACSDLSRCSKLNSLVSVLTSQHI